MKHMLRRKRQIALLTIALLPSYLFLSAFGVDASFICFSKEGHFAIEFSQSCCSRSEELAKAVSDDDYGPCTDIHFLINDAGLKNMPKITGPLSSVQGSAPDICILQSQSDNFITQLFPSPHTKNLPNHQSVVLLI
ncbi:MAG: hypothetical protein CSYNP_02068 [Syntrophus sp. SKADARSKE-3]|nr:hypothetical protein [Syntrophus sp. SKADARSKE-3]